MTDNRPSTRTVGLLSVGDELLAGAHPDLNGPYLAKRLTEWGREVVEVRAVRDVEADIARAVAEMLSRHGLVITTGGLGPTEDDVTRHGAAMALGQSLDHNKQAWGQVLAWYQRSDRQPPESNLRQALVPAGAEVIANPAGTAPGFLARKGDATLVVLPGPPREVAAVFDAGIAPWLDAHPVAEGVRALRYLHFADLSESVFADRANEWMGRDQNPLMGVTVKNGVLSVRILARAAEAATAGARAEERALQVIDAFPGKLFSRRFATPAQELAAQALELGISFTVAESCTVGRIAAALGACPGISSVFNESLVAYSAEAKTERLGVPPALLERHGAVSEPVVRAMAEGAAKRTSARLSIAVSGVAGPGGGSPDKPVGLVWFATCMDGEVRAVERRWPPADRERLQAWATQKALVLGLTAIRDSAGARKTSN